MVEIRDRAHKGDGETPNHDEPNMDRGAGHRGPSSCAGSTELRPDDSWGATSTCFIGPGGLVVRPDLRSESEVGGHLRLKEDEAAV